MICFISLFLFTVTALVSGAAFASSVEEGHHRHQHKNRKAVGKQRVTHNKKAVLIARSRHGDDPTGDPWSSLSPSPPPPEGEWSTTFAPGPMQAALIAKSGQGPSTSTPPSPINTGAPGAEADDPTTAALAPDAETGATTPITTAAIIEPVTTPPPQFTSVPPAAEEGKKEGEQKAKIAKLEEELKEAKAEKEKAEDTVTSIPPPIVTTEPSPTTAAVEESEEEIVSKIHKLQKDLEDGKETFTICVG
ncbi:unnamed protein product [Vitrella brassicaformis CCMP3155]|uniref:Uncharacterized protein n=1 Tax=Vitrella brassicaformis (strain CCMP3155) TaxID=1169540 RepID=A0A0G4H3Q4_VITBC|nr:unnamed protein product [Vitrella brassicaformis CCMP3155]|eukprot:CEM38354.1 unnamed protein product [Vitrella brassicaformis CCMP3155]